MERNSYFFDNSQTTPANETPVQPTLSKKFTNNDGAEVYRKGSARFGMGLVYFFGGLLASYLSFNACYWAVSNFDPHYLINSLVAVAFSVMIIKAWDKVTGELPTLMKGSITFFTIIIFSLSIFIGNQHSKGLSAKKFDNFLWTANDWHKNVSVVNDEADGQNNDQNKPEVIVIASQQMFPMTEKLFSKGDVVKIVVSGAPVKLVCGGLLQPGVHHVNIENDGRLCFHTLSNTSAQVEVY